MKNQLLIATLVAAIVGIGAGFAGGMIYQKSKTPTFARQFAGGNVQRGAYGTFRQAGGTNAGFRPVAGEIIASDDKTITVKLQDGSTKIVLVSQTVQINKAATGSRDDLKIGQTVAVFGQTNADGSVTAQNIQLNPIVRSPMGTGTQ